MRFADHYCLPQSYRCRVRLISEFGDEVSADRTILTKLLLKPFGISFKMLENPIIGRHEYRCHVEHQLTEMHPAATLMRSPHEENSIRRKLNGSMFLQSALPSSIRMDQSLFLSAFGFSWLDQLCQETYTFDNYASQAVGDEDYGTCPGLKCS